MIVEDLQGQCGAGGRDGRRRRWCDEQLEQESDAELGWGLLGDAYDRCGEIEHELKHSSPSLHSCNLSLNTTALTFMTPFGLGAAISIRVSNELGTG
ncbi:hypothetical protein D1007_59754 [Hordeum vulgare]|nr:hypothetical protein D1007_59754 [Hordeum vulgare]